MRRPAVGTASVVRGNALALPLAADTVDLVVTSPPYFGLRSYQDGGDHYAGQVGDEATPGEFVDALLTATAEMARVVKPTGSIWVNLGDKYASTPAGNTSPSGVQQMSSSMRAGALDAQLYARRARRDYGTPHKSLLGIPWRYALRCIDELGLILRAEVIWSKPNGLPESVKDRARRCHEQWFHFTLQPRYYSAVDEIREAYAEATHDRYAYGPAGPNPLGRLPGSVWTVPTEPLSVPARLGVEHFAAFPMEFPRRIITGWSPVGICTKCGEGRRPAAVADLGRKERETPRYGGGNHGGESSTLGSRGTSARILGHVCACTPYVDHAPIRQVERTDHRKTGLPERSKTGSFTADDNSGAWREYQLGDWVPAATTPAVVLDPFGGTGTTALVAKSLGRRGISLDMSADYCRLARWRTTDEGELARALQVEKPRKQVENQTTMYDFLED